MDQESLKEVKACEAPPQDPWISHLSPCCPVLWERGALGTVGPLSALERSHCSASSATGWKRGLPPEPAARAAAIRVWQGSVELQAMDVRGQTLESLPRCGPKGQGAGFPGTWPCSVSWLYWGSP